MFDHYCHMPVINGSLLNATVCSPNETAHRPFTQHPVSTFTYVVELYCIGTICLIGLPTNLISIVVMRRDRERRDALFLLQVLAVADVFYLTVALLRYPLKYIIHDSLAFLTMQLYVFPLLKTAQTIAIFMMVFVTIDRYIYVCYPLSAQNLLNRRKRWFATVGIVTFGFGFNAPRFFDVCIIRYVHCGRLLMAGVVYTHHFNHPLYFDIYQCALYIVVLYAVPLVLLFVLNGCLIRAIRRSRRRHRLRYGFQNPPNHRGAATRAAATTNSATSGGGDHSDNNATLVLVIIVVVFLTCETPELAYRLITARQRAVESSSMDRSMHFDFATGLELLMVVNSSTNFFIYCIFGRRFRRVLRDMFQFRGFGGGGGGGGFGGFGPAPRFTHESVPLQQQLYQG